MWVHDVNKVVA